MTYGQRLVERYISHASIASSELVDGSPIDAESMMIHHSNASFLSERTTRLIGHAPPYNTESFTWNGKDASPFNGYIDTDSVTSPDEVFRSPWTPEYSVRFGPINGVAVDLSVSPPGYLVRPVKVVARYFAGVGDQYLFACITVGKEIPSRSNAIIASYANTFTGAGVDRIEIDLIPDIPARANAIWTARESGPQNQSVSVVECYVWFSLIGQAANNIYTVSAFEVH